MTRPCNPDLEHCKKCGAHAKTKFPFTPPMPTEARPRILIVGSAPSDLAARQGIQYAGGQRSKLGDILRRAEVPLDHICSTSAAACSTDDNALIKKWAKKCAPVLAHDIAALDPDVIVTLGAEATKALLEGVKFASSVGLPRTVEIGGRARHVVPSYHPGHILAANSVGMLTQAVAHFRKAWEIAQGGRVEPAPVDYRVTWRQQDLDAALADLLSADMVAWDTETTQLSPYKGDGKLLCVQFSGRTHSGWLIPVDHPEAMLCQSDRETRVSAIRRVLTEAKALASHHGKFDRNWIITKLGFEPKRDDFDTQIAAHLIDVTRTKAGGTRLKTLAHEYTDLGGYEDEFEADGDFYEKMKEVPLDQLKKYACADTDVVLRCVPQMRAKLEAEGCYPSPFSIEMDKADWCAYLERTGMMIDWGYCERARVKFESEIDACKQALQLEPIIKEALALINERDGRELTEFNIRSFPQMAALVEVLELPIDEREGYTESGKVSTGKARLAEWLKKVKDKDARRLLSAVSNIRQMAKLQESYFESYPEFRGDDDRIHSSLNSAWVDTFRLSSSNPNLQQLPRNDGDGNEVGKGAVKRLFIPPHEDWVCVELDYSQAELRIAAIISQDPVMLDCFEHGIDLHRTTAASAFTGNDLEAVTKEQRTLGKMTNFLLIFDGSAYRLSKQADIALPLAEKLHAGFHKRFRQYSAWMRQQGASVQRTGKSRSLFGHVRRLPDVKSQDEKTRADAIRQGINFPIQCTASVCGIWAGYLIQQRLSASGLRATTCNQVHDAVYMYAHKDDLADVVKIALDTAQSLPFDFLWGRHPDYPRFVKMVADVKVGPNFADMKEYHL